MKLTAPGNRNELFARICDAFTGDYLLVYLINLNDASFEVLKMDSSTVESREHFDDFYQIRDFFLNKVVYEPDKVRLCHELDFNVIRERIAVEKSYLVEYRSMVNGVFTLCDQIIIRLDSDLIILGQKINEIGVALRHFRNKASSGFFALYAIDIDSNSFKVLRESPYYPTGGTGTVAPFSASMKIFAETLDGERREFFLNLSNPNYLREHLTGEDSLIYSYHANFTDEKLVTAIAIVLTRHEDGTPSSFLLGFSMMDTIENYRQELQNQFKENMNIINGLASEYTALYHVDFDTGAFKNYVATERIADMKKRFSQFTGWRELTNAFIDSDAVHPDYKQALRDFIGDDETPRKTLKDKKSVSILFKRKYGSEYLWTEMIAVKCEDIAEDAHTAIIGVRECDAETRERIETQKRLEFALNKASEANHRNDILNQIMKAGAWSFTIDNNNEIKATDFSPESNAVARNDLGVAMNWMKMIHPQERDFVMTSFWASIFDRSCQTPFEVEFRIRSREGLYHWIRCAGRMMRDDAGNGELYGICVDIDDVVRRRSEEQRTRHLKTFGDMINAALWSMEIVGDSEVTEVFWADEFRHMLGFKNESDFPNTLGAWMERLHPEDSAEVVKHFWQILKSQDEYPVYDVKYRLRRNTGEYCWYHDVGRMEDSGDGTRRFYGIITDISADVALEEKQAQLEEALSMAQSANRAKTVFLNNMSHDIRTPMNAIIGYTGLAASHIDNTEQVKDYLGKISQSSNHLLSLINDVLDMSRIESGKMRLDEKSENLPEIIHTIADIVRNDINTKKLTFTVDYESIMNEHIICDRLRLSQVLLNILSNAVKYTPEGGTISFTAKEKSVRKKGYGIYEFIIADNGMGMDKQFLKTIFDPFTRVRSSTVSGIQGTGLGMAITKNIVDMMGGRIIIESEPGTGTLVTVSFNFKLQTDASCSDGERRPSVKVSGTGENNTYEEKPDFSGKRALIVEDNELNREIATELLEEYGFETDTATDGNYAVEKIKSAKPGDYDVILMDIQMPTMDGYEATRLIRSLNTEISKIPILAMTANAFEEDSKAAIESGMNEHIPKPIDVAHLMSTLARFLL